MAADPADEPGLEHERSRLWLFWPGRQRPLSGTQCPRTILLLGLPLLLPRLKQATQLLRSGALWPYPAIGMLLTLLADKCRIRLGGPRYYLASPATLADTWQR